MIPTPKLRFVERLLYWDGRTNTGKIEKVLQQWWAVERAGQITPTGEWRDVSLEKEND